MIRFPRILSAFLLPLLVWSCSPLPQPGALEETEPTALLALAQRSPDPEIRARWLFLAANNAWKLALPDSPRPKRELVSLARGALLRIIELKAGPMAEARHNLAIILAKESEDLLPADDSPPDVLDLSRDIRYRPEQVLKLEAQLSKKPRYPLPAVSPVPLEEDW